MLLVLVIDADNLGQADDPADPGLLDLVELVEWAIRDGRSPEVQFRPDDVVNRPLLGHDLLTHLRSEIELPFGLRIQLADLAERPIDPGQVAFDADLQGSFGRRLGQSGDRPGRGSRDGWRRLVRFSGRSGIGERVEQRGGAIPEFREVPEDDLVGESVNLETLERPARALICNAPVRSLSTSPLGLLATAPMRLPLQGSTL